VTRSIDHTRTTCGILVVVFLLLACGVFIYRGPVRALGRDSPDLKRIYASTRGWLYQVNPYAMEALSPVLTDGGLEPPKAESSDRPWVLVYLPTTFTFLWPIAALPWPVARMVCLVGNILLVPMVIYCVAKEAGLKRNALTTWLFVGGTLAMAPLHANLSMGQLALLILFLVAVSQRCISTQHPVIAGCLLGIATAIKPQLAGLFLAYQVCRGQWRCGVAACAVIAGAGVIGVGWMAVNGVTWLPILQGNVAAFAADRASAGPEGSLAFHLINLHYLFHAFSDNAMVVNVSVYIAAALLGGILFYYHHRSGRQENELVALGMIGLLSLLVVYHRIYDALLLVFALAVCARAIRDGCRPACWIMALSLATFFTPGGALLNELNRSYGMPAWVTGGWWWRCLVMPHQILGLIVIGFCLIAITTRSITDK